MMTAAGEEITPDGRFSARISEGRTSEDWPLRPWLLAGLLGFAGLLISLLTDFGNDEEPWRVAATAFVFFGGIAAALTIERTDWKAPAIFAAIVGLVLAGLAWRAVSYGDSLPDEEYGFAAGVVASLLALPLFKAGFLKKRLATSYSDTHYHVWSDAISGAGALVFVGISWLVLALLSQLFHLLKIDLIRDLMDESWFGWSFSGVALGAALGTLRNQLKILGMLQSVVFLVLSLLGVPLAAGLVLFLLAVAITGPDVLWEATRSATPLLLSCAVGAFVLTNAIIRDDDEAASKSKVLRIAGLVLGLGILPLSVFAAYSMGIRLSQYGFSPERLWGMLAILVACFYGLAYWIGAVRERKSGWREQFRRANFFMALAVCVLALFMALPILDFGGISTRNQIARLNNGTVSAEDFDYAALNWDFGASGKAALERMAAGKDVATAEPAQYALDSESAWKARVIQGDRLERFAGEFAIDPAGAELPDALRSLILNPVEQLCTGNSTCRVFLRDEGQIAVILDDSCSSPDIDSDGRIDPDVDCSLSMETYGLRDAEWLPVEYHRRKLRMSKEEERESLRREREAIENGDITIRPTHLRQVYIGESPEGRAFE